MSQTQPQKESKDETKKKAAQQSGTAILPFLNVLANVLFPMHIDCLTKIVLYLRLATSSWVTYSSFLR